MHCSPHTPASLCHYYSEAAAGSGSVGIGGECCRMRAMLKVPLKSGSLWIISPVDARVHHGHSCALYVTARVGDMEPQAMPCR